MSADTPPRDLRSIPASGPLIVAANHPHGFIDGLVVAAIVERTS